MTFHHHSTTTAKTKYVTGKIKNFPLKWLKGSLEPSKVQGERKKISILLENPKTFLPLLLFIGLVFALVGLGWQSFTSDSGVYVIGLFIIVVAVVLWVLTKRR